MLGSSFIGWAGQLVADADSAGPSFFRGKKEVVPVPEWRALAWFGFGGCVRVLDWPGLFWRRLFLAGVGFRLRLFITSTINYEYITRAFAGAHIYFVSIWLFRIL